MSSQLHAHSEVAGESKKVYRKTRTSSATKLSGAAATTKEAGGGLPVAGRATGEGGALAAALPLAAVGIAAKRERMTLEQIIREAGGRVTSLSEKAAAGHSQAHLSSAFLPSGRKDPNSLNFDRNDRGDDTLQQRSSSKHKPLVLPSHPRGQNGDKGPAPSLVAVGGGEGGGGTRSYSVDTTWEEERGAQRRLVPPHSDSTIIHQGVNRGITPQQHHRQDVNGVVKGNGGAARMNSTRDMDNRFHTVLYNDTRGREGDDEQQRLRRAEKSPVRSSSRERGYDVKNGGGGVAASSTGRSASIVGQQTKVGGTSKASPLRSVPGTTVSRGASSSKRVAVEAEGADFVAEQRSPTLQYVSKIESELATLQDRHADLCRLMMEASAAHQLTCLEFAESEARKAAVHEPEGEERGMLGMWFHSTLRVFHSMGLERLRKDISNAYDDLTKSQRYVHKLEERLEESQRNFLQHATGNNTNNNGVGVGGSGGGSGGGAALFSSSAGGSFALGGNTPMGKVAAAASGETPLGPPAYLQVAQQQQQQQQLASSSAGLNTSALSAATIAVVVNDAVSAHHSRFQREFMQSFNETAQSLLDTNIKKGFETVGTHTIELINKSTAEHQRTFLADLMEEIEGKSRKAHTVAADQAAHRQKDFEDKLLQLEEKRDETLMKRLTSNTTVLKSDVAAAHESLVDKISQTLEKARMEDLTVVISSAVSAALSKELGGGEEEGEERETSAPVAASASAPTDSKPKKRGVSDYIGSVVQSSLSNTESLISALRQEMRDHIAEIKENHQKTSSSSVDTKAILSAFAAVKNDLDRPLKVALDDAFAQQRSSMDASIKETFSSVVAEQREQESDISSSLAAEKACEKTVPILRAIEEKIDAAVALMEHARRHNDTIQNTNSTTALADFDGLLAKRLSPLLSHQTNLATVIEASFSQLSSELLESLRREQQQQKAKEKKVKAETANDDRKLSALLLERIGGIEERLAEHFNSENNNKNKDKNNTSDSNATATAHATSDIAAATRRHVQIALKMASASFDAAVSYYTSWWSWHRLLVEPLHHGAKKEHNENKGEVVVRDLLTSLLSTDGKRGASGADRGPQALFMAYVMAKEALYNDSIALLVDKSADRAPRGPKLNSSVHNVLHTTPDNNPPQSQRVSSSNQTASDVRPLFVRANGIDSTPATVNADNPNTTSLLEKGTAVAKEKSHTGESRVGNIVKKVGGGGGSNAFDDDSSEEEEGKEERGKGLKEGPAVMSPSTTASSSDAPALNRRRGDGKNSNNGTQREGARGTNAFDDEDEASVEIITAAAQKAPPQTKQINKNADDALQASRSAGINNKSTTNAFSGKGEKPHEETKRGRALSSSSSSPSPTRRSTSLSHSPSLSPSSPSNSSSLTLSSGEASPITIGGGGSLAGGKGSQPLTSIVPTSIGLAGTDGKKTNNAKALDFEDSSDDEERGPTKKKQLEKAHLLAAPATASGNKKRSLNYSSDSSPSPSHGGRNGGGGRGGEGGRVSTDVSSDSAEVEGKGGENAVNNVAQRTFTQTAQEDLEARRRRLFGFDDENDDKDARGGQNSTTKNAIGTLSIGGVAAAVATTQRSPSAFLSSSGGGGGGTSAVGAKPIVASAASTSSRKKALPMW